MMIRGIWLWAQVDKLLDEKGITSEPSAKNRELAAGVSLTRPRLSILET